MSADPQGRERLPDLDRAPGARPTRTTVRGVVALQLAANGLGAMVVIVYLRWLFPTTLPDGGAALGLNAAWFTGYLAVTMVAAIPINAHVLRKAVAWVDEGRTPTRLERLNVLALPAAETVTAFAGWVGAAVLFGLLNEDALRVSVGVVVAGLVTCAGLYLLLERHFRPLFVLALDGTRPPSNRREILPRLMLAWVVGSAAPLLGLGAAAIGVPAEELADAGLRVTVAVIIAVVAGGLVMRAAASAVALPVEEVREAMAKVEDGDLDVDVPVTNIGELGRLQSGFNAMVVGQRERRQLRDLLGRQVGGEVAEHQLAVGDAMAAEAREVSVLFVDLAGFTSYAETRDPTDVIAHLNAFFSVVVDRVMAAGGLVNKFEGDAALCVFGAPVAQSDHAARALAVAADLPDAVVEVVPSVGVGIGVATGVAVAGNLGTAERYEYTVIGDVVNTAARLADLAKHEPEGVLVGLETLHHAGDPPGWERCGPVRLRGRTADIDVARRCPPSGGS